MQPTEPLYFAHISDTHFGPTADYERHGFRPYPCAEALVDTLNALPQKPDFVIHTGDVVTHPDPVSYELAQRVLGRLEMPVYYVTGNHDTAVLIHQNLSFGSKEDLSDDPNLLSYAFEVKGYRFVVLDARAPDDMDPHGLFSAAQLAVVRREAQPQGPPLTIFMHFPIHRMNSIWMDANMMVMNGREFHQSLLPARDRLRGVFYGHVHQSMQTVRDGILYVAAPSAFAQFTAWPDDIAVHPDEVYPPAFNFVHLLPQQTIIHQHVIKRPAIRD
ncbi:MAG: metallophosphoesterase [Ardenticatenaceae bacterium]|nr:metallophosphoesterase [Ardenticatenaceae bacterium]MCB8989756.1 metallophosphoesterase [Ardenticatenaceae bacterium]MCB9002785.1 metallophosphoesterase [Ardenticatenaceae bacterium]